MRIMPMTPRPFFAFALLLVSAAGLRAQTAPITVEADDPAARPDIAAWCRMRGHEYVGERVAEDGVAGYVVRRLQ